MVGSQLEAILQHIRRLLGVSATSEVSDAQLLECFLGFQDERAFAALIQRHGPMVFGVCRSLLKDHQDAEDAFQATFLVLARKAGTIRRGEAVGHWLYGVAHRTARKLRVRAAKRRLKESECTTMTPTDPTAEVAGEEWRQLLHQEVSWLPAKYRAPVVLCYLEGKTNEEAARTLGWPVGSVKGRLTRARDMLRTRLIRRGVALSAGALTTALSPQVLAAAVPGHLAAATAKAAAGALASAGISAQALALAEGVLKEMWMAKVKTVLAAFLAIGVLGVGFGAWGIGAQKKDLPVATSLVAEPAAEVAKAPGMPLVALFSEGKHFQGIPQLLGFSADNQKLVLATNRAGDHNAAFNELMLLDLATGKKLSSLENDQAWLFSGARDGVVMGLSAGNPLQKEAHVLDASTFQVRRQLKSPHRIKVGPGEFLPYHVELQGKYLLVLGFMGHGPQLLGRTGGFGEGDNVRAVGLVDASTDQVVAACLQPKGNWSILTTAPHEKKAGKLLLLRLTDEPDEHSLEELDVHTGKVNTLVAKIDARTWAVSPDGRWLAHVTSEAGVQLRELPQGKVLANLREADGAVNSLALSADGQLLATAESNGSVKLWDARLGRLRTSWANQGPVRTLLFSPDSRYLAGASHDQVKMWEIAK